MRKTDIIKQIYTSWKEAMVTKDVERLKQLYLDNFSWTNTMGICRPKADVLSYELLSNMDYLFWEDKDLHIWFGDETATLTSIRILKLKVFGLPVNTESKITVQFQHNNNQWLLEKIAEER